MDSALLAFFAVSRLGEGIFCVRMGLRHQRWAVLLWGGLAIILALPIAAKALGWEIPDGPALAISGGHAVLGMCVVAAMVSSTAEARRVGQVARLSGHTPPTTDGWRP
jgi:hypothetical protein